MRRKHINVACVHGGRWQQTQGECHPESAARMLFASDTSHIKLLLGWAGYSMKDPICSLEASLELIRASMPWSHLDLTNVACGAICENSMWKGIRKFLQRYLEIATSPKCCRKAAFRSLMWLTCFLAPDWFLNLRCFSFLFEVQNGLAPGHLKDCYLWHEFAQPWTASASSLIYWSEVQSVVVHNRTVFGNSFYNV